jgi:hypothetical protein
VGRAVVLLDRLADRDLAGHDRLDGVPRHEAHVVHGEHVRRIRHGDRQGRPRAVDGQHEVLLRDLRGDEVDHRLVDLEVAQVDRRNAVLLGEELRDLVFLDESQLDEVVSELPPVLLLCLERFLQAVLGDETGLQEHFP